MLEPQQLAKSNQEQAVAAWVNYLNQLRLDNLLNTFRQQDVNLEDALASVDEAIRKIDLEVVAANRGGVKGMHGFIAEVAELQNVGSLVQGLVHNRQRFCATLVGSIDNFFISQKSMIFTRYCFIRNF